MTPANLIQALFSMDLSCRSTSLGGRSHNGHISSEVPRPVEAGKVKPRTDPRRSSRATLDDACPAIEQPTAAGTNVIDIRSRRRVA